MYLSYRSLSQEVTTQDYGVTSEEYTGKGMGFQAVVLFWLSPPPPLTPSAIKHLP